MNPFSDWIHTPTKKKVNCFDAQQKALEKIHVLMEDFRIGE